MNAIEPRIDLSSHTPEEIVQVDPAMLQPHPVNVEIYGDEPLNLGLVESIKSIGIDTPLEVTPGGMIIKGHRRHRAATHLTLSSVPCRVRSDLKTQDQIVHAIIEDNRLHRDKTIRQKINEAMHLHVILKRFREESRNFDAQRQHGYFSELTENDVPGWDARQVAALREIMREYAKPDGTVRESLNLACIKVGVGISTYSKAMEILGEIQRLKETGFYEESKALDEKLNANSIGPAWATYRRKFRKPKKEVKEKSKVFGSAEDHARDALKSLEKLAESLDSDWDVRIEMVRSILKNAIEEIRKTSHGSEPA